MKELIRFELLKARHNTLYLAVFAITAIVLCLAMTVSISTYHESYVFRQHENASTILNTNNMLSKDVLDCYQEVLNSDSWQEIYQLYNKIDSLGERGKTDLNYDAQTNIDYRNYHLYHQIPPENNTSGIWMINICSYFLEYMIIGIAVVIGLNMILSEFQEHTNTYLFCLNYRYRTIFVSKLIVGIIMILAAVVLPMIIFYLIYTTVMGSSDPNTIFEIDPLFANVMISNDSFISVNCYLILKLIKIAAGHLLINMVIFIIIYFVKIKQPKIV